MKHLAVPTFSLCFIKFVSPDVLVLLIVRLEASLTTFAWYLDWEHVCEASLLDFAMVITVATLTVIFHVIVMTAMTNFWGILIYFL